MSQLLYHCILSHKDYVNVVHVTAEKLLCLIGLKCYLLPLEVVTTSNPRPCHHHLLTKEARPEIFAFFLKTGRIFLQQMSKSGEGIKNKPENMEIKLKPVALDTQKKCIRETYCIQSQTLS